MRSCEESRQKRKLPPSWSLRQFWLNIRFLSWQLHRMRRSTRQHLVSFVAALVVWCHSEMGFSGPVAKARSGAGAKDYVLVMHEMCPFAQRAWFALEESGLTFRLKEVGLGSGTCWET